MVAANEQEFKGSQEFDQASVDPKTDETPEPMVAMEASYLYSMIGVVWSSQAATP